MFLIKNGTNAISILYIGSHKIFEILMGECLKCILTYLYCINYNGNNMRHSDIYKHASYKKWYKYYKYFVYRLRQNFSCPMGGNVQRVF